MPPAFGTRAERRAFNRDAARHYATTNLGRPRPAGPNRATRRHDGQRGGHIAQAVHGPHDTAWLYSGTLNASGQARINHKRQQRAEYWRTVRICVSAEMEPAFREHLGLLGKGTRIDGRTQLRDWFAVDLDVHVPGAPADAASAEPIWRGELTDDGTYRAVLDHIAWRRADGSAIPAPEGSS